MKGAGAGRANPRPRLVAAAGERSRTAGHYGGCSPQGVVEGNDALVHNISCPQQLAAVCITAISAAALPAAVLAGLVLLFICFGGEPAVIAGATCACGSSPGGEAKPGCWQEGGCPHWHAAAVLSGPSACRNSASRYQAQCVHACFLTGRSKLARGQQRHARSAFSPRSAPCCGPAVGGVGPEPLMPCLCHGRCQRFCAIRRCSPLQPR